MVLTFEELEAAQKLIGKRQHDFISAGWDNKTSRRMAVTEVAGTYTPAVGAKEFESALAIARAKFYPRPHSKKTAKGKKTFKDLYRSWCEKSNHVSSDAELAHFAGCTPAALQGPRNEMQREGWIFTSNGSGWNVKPPEKKIDERSAKIAEIEKLLAQLKAE